MQVKKILYVVSGLNKIGGIEAFIYNIIENININQYKIDFLVNDFDVGDNKEYVESRGFKVYNLPKYNSLKEKIKCRNQFFKKNRSIWDIVHIHTVYTTAFSIARSAKKYGKCKYVITHSHTSSNYEGSLIKNTICRPLINMYTDVKVGCSKNAIEFLFGKYNSKRDYVIYNAVNIEKFINCKESDLKNELGLNNEFVIGHIGRITEAKNHKFLLELFFEYTKVHPNAKLVLVGDGEYKERVKKQITELNLNAKVIMLGKRMDIPELMNIFDVFLFPSLYEGLPTVLIEAQSVGLPIICSDIIVDEVLVNDNVKKISITSPKEEWIKAIETLKKTTKISNNIYLFESKNITKQVEELYSRLV